MQQVYKRTCMPKCDLNNVAKQFYRNHTSAWMPPVHLLPLFLTLFPKTTSEGMLLNFNEEYFNLI